MSTAIVMLKAAGIIALWPLIVFALRGPTDRLNAWCRRRDLLDERRRQEAAYRRTMRRLADIEGGPVPARRNSEEKGR